MNAPLAARRATPVALMFGAALAWPLIEVVFGAGLARHHHPIQVVWLRYTAHLVLLLAYCTLRGASPLFATRRAGLQLLRGALMFAMPVCFLLALATGPARWVWAVFWSAPLLAMLGARLLLGERAGGWSWVAAVAGWAGAGAIIRPSMGGAPSGVLALAMAGTFAGYLLLTRALKDEPLAVSLFYTAAGAALPMTLLVHRFWTPVAASDVGLVFGLGAASILFLACLDRALEGAPLSPLSPLLYAVLVFQEAVGLPVHPTLPGPAELAGAALILSAAGLLLLGRRTPALTATSRELR